MTNNALANQVNETLANQIIGRLNEIAATDPLAIDTLLKIRVPCNKAMADHPMVQVFSVEGGGMVGMLGILNGIVGVIPDGPRRGCGYIAAEIDDAGKFVRFIRTPNTLAVAGLESDMTP